jgi:hypothetical protein
VLPAAGVVSPRFISCVLNLLGAAASFVMERQLGETSRWCPRRSPVRPRAAVAFATTVP